MDKIIHAYAILKNEEYRKSYDAILDSKLERDVKVKEMNAERKKFYDDLKQKEQDNIEYKKKQNEMKMNIEKEIQMMREKIRLNEDIDDIIYGKEYISKEYLI